MEFKYLFLEEANTSEDYLHQLERNLFKNNNYESNNYFSGLFSIAHKKLNTSFPGKDFNEYFVVDNQKDNKSNKTNEDRTIPTKELTKVSILSRLYKDNYNTTNKSIENNLNYQKLILFLNDLCKNNNTHRRYNSSSKTKLNYEVMLSNNLNHISILNYLLWENYISHKYKSNYLENQYSPMNFQRFLPYLECLLKGIQSEVFVFNSNLLSFEMNNKQVRITGLNEKSTESLLKETIEIGSKAYLLNELISYVLYLSNDWVVKDIYKIYNQILIDINKSLTSLFKGYKAQKEGEEDVKNVNNSFIKMMIDYKDIKNIINILYNLLNLTKIKEEFLKENNKEKHNIDKDIDIDDAYSNYFLSSFKNYFYNTIPSIGYLINTLYDQRFNYKSFLYNETQIKYFYSLIEQIFNIYLISLIDFINSSHLKSAQEIKNFTDDLPIILNCYKEKLGLISSINKILSESEKSIYYAIASNSDLFYRFDIKNKFGNKNISICIDSILNYSYLIEKIYNQRLNLVIKSIESLYNNSKKEKLDKRIRLLDEIRQYKEKYKVEQNRTEHERKLNYCRELNSQILEKEMKIQREEREIRNNNNLQKEVLLKAEEIKHNLIKKMKMKYFELMNKDQETHIISNPDKEDTYISNNNNNQKLFLEIIEMTQKNSIIKSIDFFKWRDKRRDETISHNRINLINHINNQYIIEIERNNIKEELQDVNQSFNEMNIKEESFQVNNDIEIDDYIDDKSNSFIINKEINTYNNQMDIDDNDNKFNDKDNDNDNITQNDINLNKIEYRKEVYNKKDYYFIEENINLNELEGKTYNIFDKPCPIKEEVKSKSLQLNNNNPHKQSSPVNDNKINIYSSLSIELLKLQKNNFPFRKRENFNIIPNNINNTISIISLFINKVYNNLIEHHYNLSSKAYLSFINLKYGFNFLFQSINNIFLLFRTDIYYDILNESLDFNTLKYKTNSITHLSNIFKSSFKKNFLVNFLLFENQIQNEVSFESSFCIKFNPPIELNMLFTKKTLENLTKIQLILFKMKKFSILNSKLGCLIRQKQREVNNKMILLKRNFGNNVLKENISLIDDIRVKHDVNEYENYEKFNGLLFSLYSFISNILNKTEFYLYNYKLRRYFYEISLFQLQFNSITEIRLELEKSYKDILKYLSYYNECDLTDIDKDKDKDSERMILIYLYRLHLLIGKVYICLKINSDDELMRSDNIILFKKCESEGRQLRNKLKLIGYY